MMVYELGSGVAAFRVFPERVAGGGGDGRVGFPPSLEPHRPTTRCLQQNPKVVDLCAL